MKPLSSGYFLSDEDVDAAAGAAAVVAGLDDEVLALLAFESLLDFDSVAGFESLEDLLVSPEDLGLALP
ncbi:MAG: hypothetical protein ABSA39_00935 [Edaphobacter sp.]